MHHDTVARFDLGDAGSDFDDFATALVPEEVRNVLVVALAPGDLVDLLATDPAVFDPDQDLAHVQFGHLDVVDFERRILANQHCRLHAKLQTCSIRLFKENEAIVSGITPLPIQPSPLLRCVEAHAGKLPIEQIRLLSLVPV